VSIAGLRDHGRCVRPNHTNKHRPRCLRRASLAVDYVADEATTVTITVRQRQSGRSVNGRCVAPSRKNVHHPACHRLITIPAMTTDIAKPGSNTSTLTTRSLGVGTCQLVATPAGGSPRTTTLTITD
jgi:hypothetical protein